MAAKRITPKPVQSSQSIEQQKKGYETLGILLQRQFVQYEADRRLAELKWMQNLRQFLGIYDPDIEQRLGASQSRTYPRLTRVKCISTVSRLMSLMFPASDKNWTVASSPEPNLPKDVIDGVLQTLQEQLAQAIQGMQQGQPMPDIDLMVTTAIHDEATKRAKALETTIEDQLLELGGNKYTDYVALCRKVLLSGIIYGAGVLGGPFVDTRSQTKWKLDENQELVETTEQIYRPRFEFVPIWDYYPDMSAKRWDQMDGQFQRYVMSRKQVSQLAFRKDFMGDAIKKYLDNNKTGNYKRRTYETELKALGVQNNVNDQNGRKYELIKWEGYTYVSDLNGLLTLPDTIKTTDTVPVTVWMIDNTIIKCDLNPWYKLTKGDSVRMYHQFVFEEDDTSLVGNGLPNIMRDSQMSVCLAARMAMDNASIVAAPQLEIDLAQLRPDQDLTSIHAYKIWYRDEDAQETARPAVRELKFDSHLDELTVLMQTFMGFADLETFVGAATGGDMSKGPSEPFRTATGASILKGDAALPFKDVVRNFDAFTESVISSLVIFNQKMNPDPAIKGDYQTIARGAMSLVAKEVRGIQLDSYMQTMRPEEAKYVNWYELAKERAMVRDLPIDKVFVTEAQAKQIDAAEAQAQQQTKQAQDGLVSATTEKTQADAVKARAQAEKNSAGALGTQMKALTDGLEHGINPTPQAGTGTTQGALPAPGGDTTSYAQGTPQDIQGASGQ